ncbi:MAG TPA: methionyl-tRNA formyltransferase [Patescibacteria group bacterium]|jgi:methionyl-tRNA formyltransferase|nr:methionyl-tRNA formyltransferase [Patescibacteria group bacterium]
MKKIIFCGTADFGLPAMEVLKNKYEILAVVTQPDKPSGRNKTLVPSAVKQWAQKNGIKIWQPKKIAEILPELRASQPDLLLVAAYGQIIPKAVLDVPTFGSVNIHGSTLPKYRGATPIQTAILNGELETGVTLIKMDEKMDHGPILSQANYKIDPNDDYPTLYQKLAIAAAELSSKTIAELFEGKTEPIPQDENAATYTKFFSLQDGRINWAEPALKIYKKILALNPEPGVWTTFADKSVKILKAHLQESHLIDLPGKIHDLDRQLGVKSNDGFLILDLVQPAGKKPMSGSDFLNGLKDTNNKIFI